MPKAKKIVDETVEPTKSAALELVLDEQKKLAKAIKPIETQEQFLKVAENLKALKGLLAKIDAEFDPGIKAAKASLKILQDQKKKYREPVEELDQSFRQLSSNWLSLKAEEQRKEQARVDALRAKEIAKLEAKNEKLAAKGKAPIVAFVPAVEVAKVDSGAIKTRTDWTFEIEDESLIPEEYMVPDTVAIGQTVRALKEKAVIPGVRVFSVVRSVV